MILYIELGPQRAIVSLITDDRNTPVVQLTVRAYISTAFSVAPSSLDFGDLPPGPSNELTFEVIPRSDSIPLFITDVRASSPEIQVRRLGSNGDHQAPPRGPDRFAVSIDTPRERGPLGGQIFISTSTVPNRAVIRVRGRALGAIVAKPESLLFDFRSNSLPQTAELLLRLPGLTESVNVNVVIDPAPVGGQSLRVGEILSQNTNGDPTATVRVHCGGATKPISDSIVRIRVGAEEIHVPVFILGNQR